MRGRLIYRPFEIRTETVEDENLAVTLRIRRNKNAREGYARGRNKRIWPARFGRLK